MSKKCLDFLFNSFLYQFDSCENQYSGYSDAEITHEIELYREYVLGHIDEIQDEVNKETEKLNVCIESDRGLPEEALYKQLVLYMDQVIIPDPLFCQSEQKSASTEAFGRLLGFPTNSGISRHEICKAIENIRELVPLIEAGFVVMMPMSLMHEAPKNLPIKYSPNAFSDVLPADILKAYRDSAHVSNMKKQGARFVVSDSDPLTLGTSILIDFARDPFASGYAYQFVESQIDEYDEESGEALMKFVLAKSISEPAFSAWVNQSINQAAKHHFESKYKEVIFSKQCGGMYLSRSDFTSRILKMMIERPSTEASLASLAMHMDLPVLSQLPLADLLSIRNNYGEAFHNFRNELNSKLINVDTFSDPAEIRRQLDRIAYELNNVQVKEVQKESRKILRTLGLDAVAFSGSLITSFATGGLTAVGAAGAFVKGVADVKKYCVEINENNGFFLWKLNKLSEKYSV